MKANCFFHRAGSSTPAFFPDQLAAQARRTGYCTQTLANELGLIRRTFTRQFQEQFGVAPGEWLRWLRMADAMVLLEKRFSPKEVATALAYVSRQNFTREFLRQMRCTPAEYQALCFGVSSRHLRPPPRALIAEPVFILSQNESFAKLPLRRAA